MRTPIIVLATLLFAAACAPGGTRLTHQYLSPAYNSGEFAYAGAGRDLRTVVHGNPFGGGQPGIGQPAFGEAVTDAMQGRHWGQRTHFTTAPGADARNLYKVVLLFDPPIEFPGLRLGRDDDATLARVPRRGDGIAVFAAFCSGDKSLTEIRGSVPSATGPTDPAFRELVGDVTRALFPLKRLGDDNNNCRPPFKCN